LPPSLGILLEAPLQQFVNPWTQVRRHESKIRLSNQYRSKNLRDRFTLKCLAAGEHFKEN